MKNAANLASSYMKYNPSFRILDNYSAHTTHDKHYMNHTTKYTTSKELQCFTSTINYI